MFWIAYTALPKPYARDQGPFPLRSSTFSSSKLWPSPKASRVCCSDSSKAIYIPRPLGCLPGHPSEGRQSHETFGPEGWWHQSSWTCNLRVCAQSMALGDENQIKKEKAESFLCSWAPDLPPGLLLVLSELVHRSMQRPPSCALVLLSTCQGLCAHFDIFLEGNYSIYFLLQEPHAGTSWTCLSWLCRNHLSLLRTKRFYYQKSILGGGSDSDLFMGDATYIQHCFIYHLVAVLHRANCLALLLLKCLVLHSGWCPQMCWLDFQ